MSKTAFQTNSCKPALLKLVPAIASKLKFLILRYIYSFNPILGAWFLLTNRHYVIDAPHGKNPSLRYHVRGVFPASYCTRFFWKNYEIEDFHFAEKYIAADDSVLELGACIGGLSCYTNRILSVRSAHAVVEANPKLIDALLRNRDENNCEFHVFNGVVSSDAQPDTDFYTYDLPVTGSRIDKRTLPTRPRRRLSKSATRLKVPVLSIDEIRKKCAVDFSVLQMDIEGGELDFLRENSDLVGKIRLLIFEFHRGYFSQHDCGTIESLLENAGLSKVDSDGRTEVWMRSGQH